MASLVALENINKRIENQSYRKNKSMTARFELLIFLGDADESNSSLH